MSILPKDKRDLLALKEKYHGRLLSKDEKDYFPLQYLSKRFRRDPDDFLDQVAIGNNDYGIDAYHIDLEAKNLYLYQFKWSENHNLFRESLERLASAGIQRLFAPNTLPTDAAQNPVLVRLRQELEESRDMINKVYVHFVFKGDAEKADKGDGLASRKETLEGKEHHIKEFFGDREIQFAIQFLGDRGGPGTLKKAGGDFRIRMQSQGEVDAPDGVRMHIGFVPLVDLLGIKKQMGFKFFERNIRAGLGEDTAPNKKIKGALRDILVKKEVEPEVFTLHHNGVTLAAEKIVFDADGHAILHSPRLLNGAQTLTTFDRFMEENDAPGTKDAGRLARLRVFAKIVQAPLDSQVVVSVTIANNQQNPVDPWNLRANDQIQCDLADSFREAGLLYERQEKAFSNHQQEELDEMGIADAKAVIKIKALAQALLAIHGDVPNMSRLGEVFETEKTYADTFKPQYAGLERKRMDRIVLAYKVGMRRGAVIQHLVEESAAPQWIQPAIKRSWNLVWALVVQGLLNAENSDELCLEFGSHSGMALPRYFSDAVRSVAKTNVLPILKEVFAGHKEQIANGQLEFVRSKETYRACMAVARERFGWEKKGV